MPPPPNYDSPTTPNIFPQHAHALAGLWSCVSYHLYNVPSSPSEELTLHSTPHGTNPLGIVNLSPTGYLSAHIARRDRLGPLPSGEKWQVAGDDEVAHVARGLSMYCGRVELYQEEDAKVKGEGEGEFWWRTKVDVASDPERVGGWEVRRVRVLEWEGEGQGEGRRARVMELMPRQDLFADDGTPKRAVLRWERIE